MHELASITSGRAPPSVQRPTLSASFAVMCSWPRRNPFELHGTPQQCPAASGGIQSGCPARADTSTSAAGSEPPSGEAKIRLMHAGR